jgi:hypothetical protein
MTCTCAVTAHSRYPLPEVVVAAAPVVWGWLFQVTPFSVHVPASGWARRVRPVVEETAYRRRVADSIAQPCGWVGSENRTRALKLSLGPLD